MRNRPQVRCGASVIGVLAILGGCGDAPAAHADVAVDIESAPGLEVIEEMRIDGRAADLVPIGRIAVSDDGGIAIQQQQDHAIRFFDRSGAPLGSFGRQGDGPGEFQRMATMGWLADTLWVFDLLLGRTTLIAPDRTVARTLRGFSEHELLGTDERSPFPMVPLAIYPDRSFLAPVRSQPRVPLLRASLGRASRLIAEVPTPGAKHVDRSRGLRHLSVVHLPILYAVSPHGGYIAVGDVRYDRALERGGRRVADVTLTLVDAAGDTIFDREYAIEAEQIPPSAVDSMIAAKTAGKPPDEAARLARDVYVPPFWPPMLTLVAGDAGSVWAQLRDAGTRTRYLVVGRDGAVRATVTFPRASRVVAVDGRTAWCLERNADDVESVIRYRIEGESPAGS